MSESIHWPLAPIAVFAFKRPDHLRSTLTALQANPEFSSSPVHVFCDGPRTVAEETDVLAARKVVRMLVPQHAVIIERQVNLGLDRSIISGVTELCDKYGSVIVIEDDLEVAPNFLAYMNAALNRYASESEVMQISGYQFPVSLLGPGSAIFLPYTTSWGWATWQRAWRQLDLAVPTFSMLRDNAALRRAFDLDGSYPYFKMLNRSLERPFPNWDIVFYTNVFSMQGVVLHPLVSLVRNNGFDGSGNNCGSFATKPVYFGPGGNSFRLPERPIIDTVAYAAIKKHLCKESMYLMKIGRGIKAHFDFRLGIHHLN